VGVAVECKQGRLRLPHSHLAAGDGGTTEIKSGQTDYAQGKSAFGRPVDALCNPGGAPVRGENQSTAPERPHRVLFFWHTIGNKFLTSLSNACTNLNLTDMETCYKLFHTRTLQGIQLRENRFGFEPEVTAKISRVPNIRIYEVGISYYGRTYAEGKKINCRDGFRAIYCILKYGLFARNKPVNHLHTPAWRLGKEVHPEKVAG
jgi:hypothetical protein